MSTVFLLAQDYSLSYTLVGVFILLGILLICVPRPRKIEIEKPKKKKKK